MNFKTTIVLLVLLAAVGAVLFATREAGEKKETVVEPKKLLDATAANLTRVAFTNDEGQKIALEKTDGKWRLVEPVKAAADEMAASGLVDALVALQSRGQVDVGPTTGLDLPHFKVEITAGQKTTKFDVGSKSGAGDNLYVKMDGQTKADVVPAAVYEQFDKPLKDFRQARLLETNATEIKQIRVATTQQTLAMQKVGENWQITEPQAMPAESSAASDMTMAVSNLRAEDFVTQSQGTAELKKYGLDQPVMTVTFTSAAPVIPPATQPATQPTYTTVTFGRYEDILKKNVYAALSSEPGIVKVSASTLDAFRKKPLDLRDKKIVSIEPDHVTKISITTDKPATTQPTTREASTSTVVLERNKQNVNATTAPTTMMASATTMPATTQASTQPVEPPSKWNVASSGGVDADDTKVTELLSELHPLRADRYIETSAATQPSSTVTLAIDTTDAHHEIRLVDPGNGQPVVGSYDGLTFEVPRYILEKMEGDFKKSSRPAAPPSTPFKMPE